MVRFLGIASLLLFSHIAWARCQDPKASESYDMQLSKFSCSPCAQRSAKTIRAAPREPIVAVARSVDVRA